MAFIAGEYECKIDAKGRLTLPSKIKTNLPEVSTNDFVIQRGFEPNLLLYPLVVYKQIHEKFSALSDFDPKQRKLKRQFFRNVTPVEMDNINRILISKIILSHVQIDKEAILIGLGKYVEIWNPDILDSHEIKDEQEYSDMAQEYLSNLS